MAGVSVSAIAKFERCESEPMGDTARRIERAFLHGGIRFVQGADGSGIFYPHALDYQDEETLAKKRDAAAAARQRSQPTLMSNSSLMTTDLHFICKGERRNWRQIATSEFETGNWVVSEHVAREAVGGRVYLHEKKETLAWHGGTITKWRRSGETDRRGRPRLVFTYTVDGDFNVECASGWSMEKAIVRR